MNKFVGASAGRSRSEPIHRTQSPYLSIVLRRPPNAPVVEGARQHLLITALVDTGASQSCIDRSVATRLNLVRTGEDELIGIGGKVEANIYYCIVEVPALSLRKPMALYSPIDHDVPAMVLLGRDFLSDFVLVYEGPEQAFSFFRAGQHPDDYADGDDG